MHCNLAYNILTTQHSCKAILSGNHGQQLGGFTLSITVTTILP